MIPAADIWSQVAEAARDSWTPAIKRQSGTPKEKEEELDTIAIISTKLLCCKEKKSTDETVLIRPRTWRVNILNGLQDGSNMTASLALNFPT